MPGSDCYGDAIMHELRWYFPDTMEEAVRLVDREGAVLHGGGTGLLMAGLKRVRSLADVGRLPVFQTDAGGDDVVLGAGLTLAETVRRLRGMPSAELLCEALSGAANTPVRNRATLGGSLAFFPVWSDVAGPFLALGAEVQVYGPEGCAWVPLAAFLSPQAERRGKVVAAVRFAKRDGACFYHRETRTRVDYPSFTLSIRLGVTVGLIRDASVVLTGVTEKWRRQTAVERALTGRSLRDVDPEETSKLMEGDFSAKRVGAPEYVRCLAETALARGVASAVERLKSKECRAEDGGAS